MVSYVLSAPLSLAAIATVLRPPEANAVVSQSPLSPRQALGKRVHLHDSNISDGGGGSSSCRTSTFHHDHHHSLPKAPLIRQFDISSLMRVGQEQHQPLCVDGRWIGEWARFVALATTGSNSIRNNSWRGGKPFRTKATEMEIETVTRRGPQSRATQLRDKKQTLAISGRSFNAMGCDTDACARLRGKKIQVHIV